MERLRFQLIGETYELLTRIQHLGTKRGERDVPRCPREKRGTELRLQTHQARLAAARVSPSDSAAFVMLESSAVRINTRCPGQFFHRYSLKK